MTEKLKFENPNELSSNELKELQNFKESDLDNLNKKQLKELRKALMAEKQWYLKRSKDKKSKDRVSSLIDKVINAIDKKLGDTSDTKEEFLIKESDWKMLDNLKGNKHKVKEHKINVKHNKSLESKDNLEVSEAEKTFNSRLEKLLNPKNTLIFKIDNRAVVMEFNNPDQKKEAENLFLSLEKNFDNDKMAAYAVLSFLSKYKDNLKSVQDIYKEAGEWLYWNQVVISDSNSIDLALLDAAKKNNIKVVDVDTWNKFLNAVFKTLTLNLVNIDTADVSKDILENGDYGRKATSTDLWKWWYKIVTKTHDGKDISYSHDKNTINFNSEVIPLQEPLKHFTEKEIISNLAQKMEDILHDDNKLQKIFSKEQKHEKLPLEEKLVIYYLKSYGIDVKQIAAIDLKEDFIQNNAIKKWLESNKIVDKITSKQVAVEITQDGFFKVNPDAFNDKNAKFVKVKLDWVEVGDKKENKEVLMKVAETSYKDLMWEQPQELYDKLSTLPPVVLKDGSIIGFTKEGIYVLGKDIWDGADAVKDFLRRHEQAASIVGWAILGTITTLLLLDKIHININFEGISKLFRDLWHWLEHIGKLIVKWPRHLVDAIRSTHITKLESWLLGYFIASLPLNYQIEIWKEKYAQLYGDVKGAPSIDAELADATWEKVKLPSDEEIKEYVEAKNKFAHYVLTKLWLFKPGQETDIDYDVEVEWDGKYSILIHGKWEEAGSIVRLWDKTLYVDEWNTLEFDVKKNNNGNFVLQWINWEIKVDTFWKDDYIKFSQDKATYYEAHTIGSDEKKKTVDIEWKSFEEIYKELTEEKKDKKNNKNEKENK